ncbi:MAG: Lrp/AsnC family transcriptional regulator [Magnetococcus sp. YQC-5]
MKQTVCQTHHGPHMASTIQTVANPSMVLTPLDYRLLNEFQHDLPLTPQPYLAMAQQLGITEEEVLERLRLMMQAGLISRVGVVLHPRRVGISTLAAMRTPPEQLATLAALVNGFAEVNHNYEREHEFNLWFVITAANPTRLEQIIREIEQQSSLKVYTMPMEEDFHIDLGFNFRQ